MKHIQNLNLKSYNSYQVCSTCKDAFFPECENDIVKLLDLFKGSTYHILGNGNNVILSKDFYDDPFIIFNGNYNKFKIQAENVYAEAGTTLFDLSYAAYEAQLSGLEVFHDIPASIGGAIVMNAGANGEDISNILKSVKILDLIENKIIEFTRERLFFGYRSTVFQERKAIVLSADLTLKKSSTDLIFSKMQSIKMARFLKQPRDLPNAGSVFKRPPNRFVGPLIEELGLKGFSIGGATISEKHAGFIVNTDNATGAHIIELINYVKAKVYERFGLNLEVEQQII